MSNTRTKLKWCAKCQDTHRNDRNCRVSAAELEGEIQRRTNESNRRREAEDERDRYRALLDDQHRGAGIHRDDRQLALDLLSVLTTLRRGADPRTGQAIEPNYSAGKPTSKHPGPAGAHWRKQLSRLTSDITDLLTEHEQKIEGTWQPAPRPREWRARCRHRNCRLHDKWQSSRQGPIEHCEACGKAVVSQERGET